MLIIIAQNHLFISTYCEFLIVYSAQKPESANHFLIVALDYNVERSPPLLHIGEGTVWTMNDSTPIGFSIFNDTAHDFSQTFLEFFIHPEDLLKIDKKTGEITVAKSLKNQVSVNNFLTQNTK